ncbi:hypothetical protein GCM10011344_29440 [Dokdonia pacifica]|uniref:DUF3857 domain-containing protein n=1 Tax=Dokdonia pacifica TaxID=1627892 RepID=A0A239C363_9FLAO|nr:DUF3857 domain-containing protein [Dokdonia pacifica]GGG26768.1 hypothetical protein GCM10011344_29440 [Dokdonia pacifica]SNS14616.1 protein of unknown function [Dokdonia pacifica]
MRLLILCCILLQSTLLIAQNSFNFSSNTIPEDLKKDANSIIIDERISVNIPAIDKQIVNTYQVITVLNKNGNRAVNAYEYYDDNMKIKDIGITVYDKNGEKIKEVKKRDFNDVSAVEGGTLYSESRIMFADYTPDEYPYTIVFESEVESKTTAFISPFYAAQDYYTSTLKSLYTIEVLPELELKYKVYNDDDSVLKINELTGKIVVEATNVKAVVPENQGLTISGIVPKIQFGLNHFELKGVQGIGDDWNSFGKWMNESLLSETKEVSEATRKEILALTKDAPTAIDKAKIVYEYMQNRTRYISVQIGIGGWKPMLANDVDQLGYGDCKALTNYTKALMDVAEIPSYYTVINSSSEKEDITPDFTSIQGNHVILAVPNDEEMVWLECTSQQTPFGYIGASTDDRNALVITPEGGKIMKTKKYDLEENKLLTTGVVTVNEAGAIEGDVHLESTGILYGSHFGLEFLDAKDKNEYYKEYWDYINNLKLIDIQLDNNKDEVVFKEDVTFSADSYATYVGEEMILPANFVTRSNYIPTRYKDRKQPLVISRSYNYEDEVTIKLPEGMNVKFVPEPIQVVSDFGEYTMSIVKEENGDLTYKRYLKVQEGMYPKDQYKAYRSFRRKIAKGDNQKIILTK